MSLDSGSSSSVMAAVFSSGSRVPSSGHRYPSLDRLACCLETRGPTWTGFGLAGPIERPGLPH